MARRKFSNWITAYKKLLLEKGIETEESIKTLDEEAFRYTHFNKGATVQEALEDEMYYSSMN